MVGGQAPRRPAEFASHSDGNGQRQVMRSLFIGVFFFLPLAATGAPTAVYVVAGQSNAVGALGSYGVPPDVTYPIASPYYYSVTAGTQLLDGRQDAVTTLWSTGGVELLVAGLPNAAIVKVAANGTSVAVEWNHDYAESWSHRLLAKTHQALDSLPDAYLAGVVWVQGEADASVWERAYNYGDRLMQLVDLFAAEFGETPWYYNQLNSGVNLGWKELLRSEQARLDNLPGMTMINVDDLPLGPDHLHYGPDSMVAMGRRFVEAIAADQDPLADWRRSFGLGDDGDFNGDGITDGADFLAWQRGASVTNVPEPTKSTLVVLLLAISIPCRFTALTAQRPRAPRRRRFRHAAELR